MDDHMIAEYFGGASEVSQAQGEMGVYDHMTRPSMGHRLQVEQRESMQQYHGDKASLQQQLSELCFDNKNLYTSPVPPSTAASVNSSVKSWRAPGSKFNRAPEKAAERALQAKLKRDSIVNVDPQELKSNRKFLPPIQTEEPVPVKEQRHSLTSDGSQGHVLPCVQDQESVRSSNQSQEGDALKKNSEDQPSANAKEGEKKQAEEVCEKKSLRFGTSVVLKTPLSKKAGKEKTTQPQKKVKRRKSVLKDKPNIFLKLPTVYNTSHKKSQWDSGQNHIHRKGKSVGLETSRVREECQNFSRKSVLLPPIMDSRRMEVQLPLISKGVLQSKLTPRRQAEKPFAVAVVYTRSTPVDLRTTSELDNHLSLMDDRRRQPETDSRCESVGYGGEEEEELVRVRDSDRLELPPLPVVRLSESKLSRHNFQCTTRHVPRLKLDRGASPSLMSITTARSGTTGVTAATYMSQETLEWKGEYMTCGSFSRKNRMLTEIVQVVRQRMRENEEDLKMSGRDPRPRDLYSAGQRSDQLLDGYVTPSSDGRTSRTTARRHRLGKPIQKRQTVAASVPQSGGARLHTYLQKLSHRRKAMEQRHQRDRVRFQLANMTIREITQSSIGGPASTLHTVTTPQVA